MPASRKYMYHDSVTCAFSSVNFVLGQLLDQLCNAIRYDCNADVIDKYSMT